MIMSEKERLKNIALMLIENYNITELKKYLAFHLKEVRVKK